MKLFVTLRAVAEFAILRPARWLWNLLWGEKTPLLVTIILAVAAAYLSPLVTERFERQKMRSEYVLGNLKDLNTLISDLYVEVTRINYAVANKGAPPKQSIEKSREIIARLNWKLIETAAMLPEAEHVRLMRFQASVVEVGRALDAQLDVNGCQKLLDSVSNMALEGAGVIQAIGRNVELGDTLVPGVRTAQK